MSETIRDDIAAEQAAEQEMVAAGTPWTSLLLLLVVAAGLFLGGSLLPKEQPITDASSMQNWLAFAGRILRDLMFSIGILAVCTVVSLFLPQIGLWTERLVLRSRRQWFLLAAFVVTVAGSATICRVWMGGLPHVQDETAMLFQAKNFASGHLYAHTPPMYDFFDHEYVVADGPRWYGKYFPVPSLAFVPGVWLGIPWVVNPLMAGLTVLLTWWLGRELLGEKVARIAVVLMVVSPFRASLFAMMMAHPATMLAVTLTAVAVVKVVQDPSRWGWAALAAIGLGLGLNARPLTAAALGGVMGACAAVAMPWRRLRAQTVVAFAVPMLLSVGAYFAYNQALTGNPRVTPFQKWCPKDHLGFGPDIGNEYWPERDRGHSLAKAISHNTFFSLDGLGVDLTGMGYTTLLLLAAGPLFCRSRRVGWALGAISAALVVAYFFYFTPSVFAGQVRYWSESMPAMLLLVAVSMGAVRRWMPHICRLFDMMPAVRTGRSACWLAGLVIAAVWVPQAYSSFLQELDSELWVRGVRLHNMIEARHLENAVVFLPTRHYRAPERKDTRWDNYGCGFCLNDVELKGPVVFARDLGRQRDAELMKLYPGRQAYTINLDEGDEAELIPIDWSATQPAVASR